VLGNHAGGHIVEADLTLEETAEIHGEELALPRIELRGLKNIITNAGAPPDCFGSLLSMSVRIVPYLEVHESFVKASVTSDTKRHST
jgi:hypothetical protein